MFFPITGFSSRRFYASKWLWYVFSNFVSCGIGWIPDDSKVLSLSPLNAYFCQFLFPSSGRKEGRLSLIMGACAYEREGPSFGARLRCDRELRPACDLLQPVDTEGREEGGGGEKR